MKNILVVVDIQNDFVDGTLGTREAVSIIDNAVNVINSHNGAIFVTLDTHTDDYLNTAEGKNLPVPHCIKNTDGWQLNNKIQKALNSREVITIEKTAFGSLKLPELIKEYAGNDDFEITLIGLCTDICVVSNALILKANFPETTINVIADCCAGVTPDTHKSALTTMQSCQINII